MEWMKGKRMCACLRKIWNKLVNCMPTETAVKSKPSTENDSNFIKSDEEFRKSRASLKDDLFFCSVYEPRKKETLLTSEQVAVRFEKLRQGDYTHVREELGAVHRLKMPPKP